MFGHDRLLDCCALFYAARARFSAASRRSPRGIPAPTARRRARAGSALPRAASPSATSARRSAPQAADRHRRRPSQPSSRSAYSNAKLRITGATATQGPHHSAPKSTSTGRGASSTVLAKVSVGHRNWVQLRSVALRSLLSVQLSRSLAGPVQRHQGADDGSHHGQSAARAPAGIRRTAPAAGPRPRGSAARSACQGLFESSYCLLFHAISVCVNYRLRLPFLFVRQA